MSTVIAYKDEILSINQVRNCLVHRNALVDDDKPIALRYFDMGIEVMHNGKIVKVTKEFKKDRTIVQGMDIRHTSKIMSFEPGAKITMSPDTFKGVTYTCILFIHEIIWKLPLDDNIKSALAPPFQMNLALATKND